MWSWKIPVRIVSVGLAWPALALSCLANLPAGRWASAEDAVPIQAVLNEQAPPGARLRITGGDYPPAGRGTFAFEAGDDSDLFSLDDATGTLTLNRPDDLSDWQESDGTLFIQYTRRETAGQSSRRRFLKASGLSDEEISRRLGLTARYRVMVRLIPALAFPNRPFHFSWPAEGEIVDRVQVTDPERPCQYRLIEQRPENWLEIDPDSGTLWLVDPSTDRQSLAWRGTVEAFDAFGQRVATTVWISEPLAIPSFDWTSPKAFWPDETLTALKTKASEGWSSLSEAWGTDSVELAPPTMPEPIEVAPSVSEPVQPAIAEKAPAVETEQTIAETAPAGPPVSRTSWIFAFAAAVLAALWYLIFRRSKSQPDSEPEEKSEENTAPEPAGEDDVEWDELLEPPGASEDAPLSRGGSARTRSHSSRPPGPRGPVVPGPFEEAVSLSEDFEEPGESAMNRPAAAELQDGSEQDPQTPRAPSTQEVETLLSLLDEDVTEAEGEDAPKSQSPADGEMSISTYMSNLLAKYSNPPSPTGSQPGEDGPDQSKPERRPNRRTKEIPEPIANYDREMTRSQLEELRKTSNLNAANALRVAAARRRRQKILQWSTLVVLVGIGICAVRWYLLNY